MTEAMGARRVIDFHTHAFPEKVVERAMEHLEEVYQTKAPFDGRVGTLLRHMDESGVDISVILPVATKPSQVESINTWAAEVQSERLVCFGALHPDYPRPRAEIRRMRRMGLRGVKFHPNFQEFHPDDERMFPIYEALAEEGLVVLFHAGNDMRPRERVFASPERIAKVAERFPGLRLVAAHLGGYLMWREAEEHLVGHPVWLDLSYVFAALPTREVARLVRLHGPDRVLFGTDFPFARQDETIERVRSLGLSEAELGAILGGNAERLLFGPA